MEGYIFKFEDRSFSPDGEIKDGRNVDAHNQELEARELGYWQVQPNRYHGYVQRSDDKPKAITTWLGAPLGVITRVSSYINNFGARIACIRVKGTNGAEYYGYFGYDNGELVRLRKVKS